MWKRVLLVFVLLLLCKLFVDYFRSPSFQKYGDDNKAQWTCRVNSFQAELYLIMSRYEDAYRSYGPILTRCPGSSMLPRVELRMAECLEKMGNRYQAVQAYDAYVEKYPGTQRAQIARKCADMLRSSR